jgi:hypothetical protein
VRLHQVLVANHRSMFSVDVVCRRGGGVYTAGLIVTELELLAEHELEQSARLHHRQHENKALLTLNPVRPSRVSARSCPTTAFCDGFMVSSDTVSILVDVMVELTECGTYRCHPGSPT